MIFFKNSLSNSVNAEWRLKISYDKETIDVESILWLFWWVSTRKT